MKTGKFMQLKYCLGSLALLVLLMYVQALTQTTTGSIYGTVADQSGAVISRASVAVQRRPEQSYCDYDICDIWEDHWSRARADRPDCCAIFVLTMPCG